MAIGRLTLVESPDIEDGCRLVMALLALVGFGTMIWVDWADLRLNIAGPYRADQRQLWNVRHEALEVPDGP
jgi:hypothetical protein